jgi:hypothetical protein
MQQQQRSDSNAATATQVEVGSHRLITTGEGELYVLDRNTCTNQIEQVNNREYDPKRESFFACFAEVYHEYVLPSFVTEEINKEKRKKQSK